MNDKQIMEIGARLAESHRVSGLPTENCAIIAQQQNDIRVLFTEVVALRNLLRQIIWNLPPCLPSSELAGVLDNVDCILNPLPEEV